MERYAATFIRSLDAMKAEGKGREIFGGAYLLSEAKARERAAAERAAAERAAAERAAAERAAAHVWALSDRERAIVAGLSGGEEGHSPPAANPDPFDLETLMNLPKEAT